LRAKGELKDNDSQSEYKDCINEDAEQEDKEEQEVEQLTIRILH
jgi:hypothetical protein